MKAFIPLFTIEKIDILSFSLKSAFHFSFSHNGGLVQKTPKHSLFKDQEIQVIDESPSGMDLLSIRCGYLLIPCVSCDFLLERFDLLTQSVLTFIVM